MHPVPSPAGSSATACLMSLFCLKSFALPPLRKPAVLISIHSARAGDPRELLKDRTPVILGRQAQQEACLS